MRNNSSVIKSNSLNYQADSLLRKLQNYLTHIEQVFIEFLTHEHASKKTKNDYKSDIRNFLLWVYTHLEPTKKTLAEHHGLLRGITAKKIFQYKNALIEQTVPQATINRRLSALRAFFRCAMTNTWIETNPIELIGNIPKVSHPPNHHSHHLTPFAIALGEHGIPPKHIQEHIDDIKDFFLWFEKEHHT